MGIRLGIRAALLLWAAWLPASIVVEMSLADLASRARAILHGRCLEVVEAPQARPVPYTEYTFEVLRGVKGCEDAKGKALETITFRQPGVRAPRPRLDGIEEARLTSGAPSYLVGDELVLFLTKESRLGLCAPVGLDQGALRVQRAESKAFVRNQRGARLFEKVDATGFAPLGPDESAMLSLRGERLDVDCFLRLCAKLKPR